MDGECYIGYIKYDGCLVEDGLMDARKQANALLGLDQALRFFIAKLVPEFRGLDFEIPIRVNKGSWEALIPETVGEWFQAGLGVVATAYFSQAAQRMADRDFADIGLKDVFKKSISAIKWFAKIGKHLGSSSNRKFDDVKFGSTNMTIGLKNEAGEYLFVPKEIFDLYTSTNPKILERIAANIETGRTLKIGTIENSLIDEVSVGAEDKWIFCNPDIDPDDGVLFPELAHGDQVILEGEVTRENKTTNSMGFKYNGHILTAYPQVGSIVPYKKTLFLKCTLHAIVSRMDEDGFITSKRPKLYFSSIIPVDASEADDLFS